LGGFSFSGISVTGICFKKCSVDADCGRAGYKCTAYTNPLAAFMGGAMMGDGGTTAPTVCQPGM
jgi:hypothetical protein